MLNTRIRGIQIADGGVDTVQLASDAVTTVKITDKNVTLAKLEDGSSANLIVASGAGVPTYVAMSGDIAIDNAGVTAIGATKVVDSMMNDDVASGLAGAGLTATAGVLAVDSPPEDIITEAEIKFENQSALCNGVTVAFSLASPPVVNSVQVFLNGLLQEEGSGKDYVLSGSTVTFAVAPETNDLLLFHYIAT